MGMIGFGGPNRGADQKPVGVYWDETTPGELGPHNPQLFRLPRRGPPDSTFYEAHQTDFACEGDPHFSLGPAVRP